MFEIWVGDTVATFIFRRISPIKSSARTYAILEGKTEFLHLLFLSLFANVLVIWWGYARNFRLCLQLFLNSFLPAFLQILGKLEMILQVTSAVLSHSYIIITILSLIAINVEIEQSWEIRNDASLSTDECQLILSLSVICWLFRYSLT